jgi:two-component system CheB/CheR fusion protein
MDQNDQATYLVSQPGQRGNGHYIVAIGTSAGGLEALKVFFDNVPADCPHSFVVVQHLSPDYKSLMAELLAKNTELPIHEVTDGIVINEGSIYLIPPRKNMTINGNHLHLTDKPTSHDLNLPIDIFFRSLAETQRERAIGIVLSGTGSDGTRGVRAIKEAGGMVMVQNPEQAKFDGMPQSAINTGLVDFVLPVEQMPGELLNFIDHPHISKAFETNIENDEGTLGYILNHLRNVTTLDFSQYKRPTLVRRLSRRMGVNKCNTLTEYLSFIHVNPEEVYVLSREFLIGVTKFFRDEYVWGVLEKKVLPTLIRTKAAEHDSIKLWLVGCSTGEEAYSMAISLHEEMTRIDERLEIKIFATDVMKDFLDVASKGIYPESIVADVSAQRLERYFVRKGDHYQIIDAIRRMVIFSHHNVLQDPPFSKMDIVMCRNLLIYFQSVAQDRALNMLHYSLNLNGILVLGTSETVGNRKHVLQEMDRKARIYRNTEIVRSLAHETLTYSATQRLLPQKNRTRHRITAENRMAEVMSEALADELGIASVYVDQNFDILHVVGEFKKFIELPEKGFSVNLLQMVPEKLSVAISTAARKALKSGERVLYKNVKISKENEVLAINVLAHPFDLPGVSERPYLLVMLMPLAAQESRLTVIKDEPGRAGSQRVIELEEELRDTRENLQTIIEEVETSNEELQATNEELLAANEELQSTNEELQSVNEELHTVNAEHQLKLDEISMLNVEIDNLLKSTEIGTIFLDQDMRIRRLTPAIKKQFNLRETDVGRPISHFTSRFGEGTNLDILENAHNVLSSGNPFEKEVQTNDGRWYLKRITPFIDSDNQIGGVVISFVEITELKEAQDKYARQNAAFEQVLEASMAGYWDWMIQDGTEYLSPIFKKMFGYEDHQMENSPEAWQKIIHPDDFSTVTAAFNQHIETRGEFPYDNEVRYFHKDGSTVWVYCRGKVIEWDEQNQPVRMVGSHVDITPLKKAQTELERSNKELQQFAYIASHDLQEPLRTITSFAKLLQRDYQDNLDEKADTYLRFMSEATVRMSDLIKGLLDYSRLGRDKELTRVDCNNLVATIQGDLGVSIAETDTTLEVGNLPQVQGYETELRLLFQNLIENAIKFRKNGNAPHIKVSAQQEDGYWKFAVQDNGIGIAEQHQERIFQIFQRLHPRDQYEGTGIGLSHSQKIVELHGGSIWVESQLNQGSTFYFTIPQKKVS